jgi:hypothetical protein
MIRNAMFGLSLLALSTGSAFAASKHHAAKPVVVAETAPAAPADAPAADKADKKVKKSTKKSTKAEGKTEGKTEGAKEMKAAPAPATK